MQKYTHTYKDYDGEEKTEDLYFNLRRDELAKNLHLKDEFESFDREIIQGERREMTSEEVRRMFKLLEELLSLTYGVRAGEGNRRFEKAYEHPEVWANFYEAAVYDSFIFWLFEDTQRANDFMTTLMPEELRDAAAQLNAEEARKTETVSDPTVLPKNPTPEELQAAWREKEQRRLAEMEGNANG